MSSGYNWRETPPISNEYITMEVKQAYNPRIKPHNLFVRTSAEVHQMEPTEYLICYSNGLVSVGMIKRQKDIKDQPLTMQFGNCKHLDGKELYVGCTVIVKSYVRMTVGEYTELKPIVDRNATHRDFFYNQCISTKTSATKWAIVKKPKIEKALGRVTEFSTKDERHGRLRFTGKIYDQENNLTITVADDNWPTYIKEPVKINHPVIINWIKLEEPYTIYSLGNCLQIIFPIYADIFLRVSKGKDQYWLGWVDTHFT